MVKHPRALLFFLIFAIAASASVLAKGTFVPQAAHAIQAALVTPPKDGEVCFSPDEPCDIKLQKFIESARQSLDIAIYDISLDSIAHQILVLSKKIPVRVVVDKRQTKEKNSLVPMLLKAGANVRYGHQRGIMHNKFTVVDGKMVETGSFNYTNHAARANNENQVYLATPVVVARYQKRFEEIWTHAKPASSRAVTAN